MRKRVLPIFLALFIIMSILPSSLFVSASGTEAMRGAWIASVYNIDFPSKTGLTKSQQMAELDAIIATAANAGLNALFFQVRPTSDALYKSSVFPWSSVLTGTQGKENAEGFDPLAYIIEAGKKNGIEIHAWINPLRVTTGTTSAPNTSVKNLAATHPARLNPSYTVASGGMLYFDPGIPQVRQLIIDGVKEIVENYDVAGVHFDDYFYPQTTFDDSSSFNTYGGNMSKADWRRGNINSLIKGVYDAVKLIDADVDFGVSPFGVWADKSIHPEGSDTSGGLSTYAHHYADSRKWVQEGWVDYICPQIYWGINYSKASFSTLLNWWSNVCRDTEVDLYVGHALYKVGDEAQNSLWMKADEIPNQINLVEKSSVAKGSVFYGYSKLKANALGVTDYMRSVYSADKSTTAQNGGLVTSPGASTTTETPPVNTSTPDTSAGAKYPMPDSPADKQLVIAGPSNNYNATSANISILGSCDPAYPLYFQGNPVAVTADGHFCVYPALSLGANTFTFTHKGVTKTLTVNRKVGASSSPSSNASSTTLKKAEFLSGSIYPSKDVTKRSGSTITFGCTAPTGATIWVEIGGEKVYLTSDSGSKTPSLTAAKYTGTYTVPSVASGSKSTLLGAPRFVMQYNGNTISATPGNKIYGSAADYYRYISVTEALANTRSGPSTSYSQRTSLAFGATDYIYGEQNDFYYLRSGIWIYKGNVSVTEGMLPQTTISSVTVSERDRHTIMDFAVNTKTPYDFSKDGNKVTITLYNTSAVQPYAFASDLVELVSCTTTATFDAEYVFTLKNAGAYNGYFIEYTDAGLTVGLKNPPEPAQGASGPLSGTRVLLDAGHGGSDPGAVGPMGDYGPNEKHLTLAMTLYARDYLVAQGAEVILTRETDVYMSLSDRVTKIKNVRPDISVSIHTNSLDYSTNYNGTSGIMTFYTQELSKPVADYFHDQMLALTGKADKKVRQQSLAVCRLDDVPAILFEAGFTSNPEEFEWLSKPENQKEMGESIAKAIESWLLS